MKYDARILKLDCIREALRSGISPTEVVAQAGRYYKFITGKEPVMAKKSVKKTVKKAAKKTAKKVKKVAKK